MSVLTLIPRSQSAIPTPPAGFVTFFIDSSNKKGYIKTDNGTIIQLNDIDSLKLTDGLNLLGTINDVSTVVSPKNGDKYLIGNAPIGILSGNTNNVALYWNNVWNVAVIPNNTLFSIKVGNKILQYHNNGTFPTNVITKVIFDSKVHLHDITVVQSNIQSAFNNSTQITINEYDTIFIKWTNGVIIKFYVWVGLRTNLTWGTGSGNTAVANDFFEIPVGKDTFDNSVFRVFDGADATKKVGFTTTAIATGVLRNLIIPNEDVNLSKVNNAVQTDGSTPFVNPQIGVNAIGAQDLVPLAQAQALLGSPPTFFKEILSTDVDGTYVPIGTEQRYIVIHNLNLTAKERFLFNLVDKLTSEVIIADAVFAVDVNTLHVIFDVVYPSATDGVYISVMKS